MKSEIIDNNHDGDFTTGDLVTDRFGNVLLTTNVNCYEGFSGIVLHKGLNVSNNPVAPREWGEWGTQWKKSCFTKFNGTLKLSND